MGRPRTLRPQLRRDSLGSGAAGIGDWRRSVRLNSESKAWPRGRTRRASWPPRRCGVVRGESDAAAQQAHGAAAPLLKEALCCAPAILR